MPTLAYALEEGGPRRLEVSWDEKGLWVWRDFSVQLDGETVGVIATEKQLRTGQEFALADGCNLRIQASGLFSARLHLLRDGKPIPGSGPWPENDLRSVCQVVFAIAAIGLMGGLLQALQADGSTSALAGIVITLVLGLGMLALSLLARRGSIAALAIAFAAYVVDSGFYAVSSIDSFRHRPPTESPSTMWVYWLIFRVYALVAMIQGIRAIRQIRRREAGLEAPPAAAEPGSSAL